MFIRPVGSSTRFLPQIQPLEDRQLLSFAPAVNYAAGPNPRGLVADVFRTGTGLTDLAVTNETQDTVSVLPGKPDGTFGTRTAYGVGDGPVDLATGDLNCNGSIDLAISNENGSNVSGLYNTGGRRFFPQPLPYATASGPFPILVADLTGDGKPDILTGHYTGSLGNNTLRLLKGNCSTTFDSPATINGGGTWVWDVATADFNGDGALDLAVTHDNAGGPVSVVLGNGNGTFKPPVNYSTNNNPKGVALGDLNGDGILDILIGLYPRGEVGILLGNGDGTFQATTHITVGPTNSASAVVIADFGDPTGVGTPDGLNDFAVTMNLAANAVEVCYNSGSVPFFNCVSHTVGSNPLNLVTGYFDGNDLPDLVSANYGSANVSVLLNTASPAPAPNAPPFLDPASIGTLTSLKRAESPAAQVSSTTPQQPSPPMRPVEITALQHEAADTNCAVVRLPDHDSPPVEPFSAIMSEPDGLADPAYPRYARLAMVVRVRGVMWCPGRLTGAPVRGGVVGKLIRWCPQLCRSRPLVVVADNQTFVTDEIYLGIMWNDESMLLGPPAET